MFVLALKQPEVSKPSLQSDSALDTDDGITQTGISVPSLKAVRSFKLPGLDLPKRSVPIVEELLLLESEGIEAYDAFSDCQVWVVAPLICVICDNPRAKELCNQLASSTRKYCRICMADKIDSPDVIGVPRTRALSLSQMEEISSQTSISRTYNTRKKYGIKEHIITPCYIPISELIFTKQYGPTSAFSAERAQNIYSNRQAPSRDIGKHFAVLEHVRHIVDGGRYGQERCGDSLRTLCSTKPMQAFLYQTSVKELSAHEGIYKPGTPRLVTTECRGIVAQSFQLVHTGDYVELDVPCELKFGVLLSVCKLAVGSTVCFIQMFEPLFIRIGEPLLSDTDCPMFELSRNIEAVEGCKVLKAVSFVHDCFSEGCHFEEMESTARGVETHPRAEHFSSLAWCFLLSVASRTAPNVAPASAKVEGFSGETTEMSRATGLPRFQFCNRISAGLDCEWSGKSPAPTSTWTEACAR
eukprot:Em0016g855a